MSSNVWYEIIHEFSNLDRFTVEVWRRTNEFIPDFIEDEITYLGWDQITSC